MARGGSRFAQPPPLPVIQSSNQQEEEVPKTEEPAESKPDLDFLDQYSSQPKPAVVDDNPIDFLNDYINKPEESLPNEENKQEDQSSNVFKFEEEEFSTQNLERSENEQRPDVDMDENKMES